MTNRSFAVLLSLLLLHTISQSAMAASPNLEQGFRAAEVKQEIVKRGTGKKAGVKIKLDNNSELKGYISQVGADSFVLLQEPNGVATTLAYSEIAEVKGKGLSKAAKIGIGVGAAALGAAAAIALSVSNSDFGLEGN